MSDKKCHHGNLRNTFIKTGIKSSAHQEGKSVSRQLRIKLQKRKAHIAVIDAKPYASDVILIAIDITTKCIEIYEKY